MSGEEFPTVLHRPLPRAAVGVGDMVREPKPLDHAPTLPSSAAKMVAESDMELGLGTSLSSFAQINPGCISIARRSSGKHQLVEQPFGCTRSMR